MEDEDLKTQYAHVFEAVNAGSDFEAALQVEAGKSAATFSSDDTFCEACASSLEQEWQEHQGKDLDIEMWEARHWCCSGMHTNLRGCAGRRFSAGSQFAQSGWPEASHGLADRSGARNFKSALHGDKTALHAVTQSHEAG